MEEKNQTHVLIIGAGVTGLAIAQGLRKAGIHHTVFENEASASTYRPREWTMGIHWSLPLLESLLPADIASRLNETFVDPGIDWTESPLDRMRMINGLTGDIMKDVPIRGKIVRVSRRKLRSFLTQGVGVKYDHRLVGIEYDEDGGGGVTAVFANGARERGFLVVGTDGPKSAVRGLVFGDGNAETTPLDGVIHVNATYCVGDAEKARFLRSSHPIWSIVMHPELFAFLSVLNVPDAEKPETWHFQILAGWLGNREDFPTAASRLAEYKRKGAMLPEPFKSAVQWIPDDTPLTFDALNYWESKTWDTRNGRVVLAGDAAHPMPPHRGQGLNHALQDAYNLVTLLTTQENTPSTTPAAVKQTAMQAFANEVAARGAEEVELSRQNSVMVLNWKEVERSPVFRHSLDRSPVVGDGGAESEGRNGEGKHGEGKNGAVEENGGGIRNGVHGKTDEHDDGIGDGRIDEKINGEVKTEERNDHAKEERKDSITLQSNVEGDVSVIAGA